jgi:hypothetical protein
MDFIISLAEHVIAVSDLAQKIDGKMQLVGSQKRHR